MDPSNKKKKDHIKIMDKDVKVIIIIENPNIDFDADMHLRYCWDMTAKFYLHRKFKLLPARLDKEYYNYCFSDTTELKQDFDIIKLIQDCCKTYEREEQKTEEIRQLQQHLNDWDGSYKEEGDGE